MRGRKKETLTPILHTNSKRCHVRTRGYTATRRKSRMEFGELSHRPFLPPLRAEAAEHGRDHVQEPLAKAARCARCTASVSAASRPRATSCTHMMAPAARRANVS